MCDLVKHAGWSTALYRIRKSESQKNASLCELTAANLNKFLSSDDVHKLKEATHYYTWYAANIREHVQSGTNDKQISSDFLLSTSFSYELKQILKLCIKHHAWRAVNCIHGFKDDEKNDREVVSKCESRIRGLLSGQQSAPCAFIDKIHASFSSSNSLLFAEVTQAIEATGMKAHRLSHRSSV